jgi:glutamate racemase
MNNPILFLDSGIGCLPYAAFFHSRNPQETVICVGDRANFPYGPKSKERIIDLLSSLTEKLVALYAPKILALACNTMSVSALSALRERFPELPIVGTVPAIKPAVQASAKRRIGVLGTQRTIEDSYITELTQTYGPDCAIEAEAAAGLVEFIEHRWAEADKEERLLAVKPWIEKFIAKGVDALVLACTHFLLLKDEFTNFGGETIKIFDSVEGICHRVESLLASENPHSEKQQSEGPHPDNPCASSESEGLMSFKITGVSKPEPYWEKLANHFGMSLETI